MRQSVMNASCSVQWIRPPFKGALCIIVFDFIFKSLRSVLMSARTFEHLHLTVLLISDAGRSGDFARADFGVDVNDEGGVPSSSLIRVTTGSFSVEPKAAVVESFSTAPASDILLKVREKKNNNDGT